MPFVGKSLGSQARWEAWQTSQVSTRLLSPGARQQGYTVLHVHPQCREAFLALEGLLTLYGHLAARRSCPAMIQGLWKAWVTWTLRLTAYLRRVAQSRDATCPPCPFTLKEPL